MSNESEVKLNQADEHHHSFDSNQSANSRKRVILSPAHNNLRGAASKLRKQTMDEDINMAGERRANFSALCTANSGSTKIPVNNSSKPGDIRKLVIKNFKSKFNVIIAQFLFSIIAVVFRWQVWYYNLIWVLFTPYNYRIVSILLIIYFGLTSTNITSFFVYKILSFFRYFLPFFLVCFMCANLKGTVPFKNRFESNSSCIFINNSCAPCPLVYFPSNHIQLSYQLQADDNIFFRQTNTS